jgi:putative acetyltransferase
VQMTPDRLTEPTERTTLICTPSRPHAVGDILVISRLWDTMRTQVTIRPETPADHDAVDQVIALAFDDRSEPDLVRGLRDAVPVLSELVAVMQTEVVGYALFTRLPIETEDGIVPAVALGPVAVLPRWQRTGIGSALIREGLEVCRQHGESIVIVVGHPRYYPRFGFSHKLARNLRCPFFGKAWMALELRPGALSGLTEIVRYPPAWGMDDLLDETHATDPALPGSGEQSAAIFEEQLATARRVMDKYDTALRNLAES